MRKEERGKTYACTNETNSLYETKLNPTTSQDVNNEQIDSENTNEINSSWKNTYWTNSILLKSHMYMKVKRSPFSLFFFLG